MKKRLPRPQGPRKPLDPAVEGIAQVCSRRRHAERSIADIESRIRDGYLTVSDVGELLVGQRETLAAIEPHRADPLARKAIANLRQEERALAAMYAVEHLMAARHKRYKTPTKTWPAARRSPRAPSRPAPARATQATTPSGGTDPPPPEPPRRRLSAPVLVDQRSALEVLNWTSRRFIDFVRRKNVRYVIDRRLIVARLDDVLRALGLTDEPETESTAGEPEWSPDDVVAAIRGRR